MNKVFKVIWSEARNAYVVVSEIAKNMGSKSCSTKKLLAMLLATGVMTCAGVEIIEAAKPAAATTVTSQYVATKAAEFSQQPRQGKSDTWGGYKSYSEAITEYNAQKSGSKTIDGYTYNYDTTNKYWVRDGYVLTIDENGGQYTPLSANAKRADVANGGVDKTGILEAVASTISANGTVTNIGESLSKVTPGSFSGVSHSGGVEVPSSWDYIIQDSSWKNHVASSNYSNGYADLVGNMETAFKTSSNSSDFKWDETQQAYTYKGTKVDYSNMYVIDGKLGVFTNYDGSAVYTGTVYGKNNEILMTVKDGDSFYSYWAASVTDPSATMTTYRVADYKKDLATLEENDNKLYRNDIKKVAMTTGENTATFNLLRNGDTDAGTLVEGGAITITSGGGTGGSGVANDTWIKVANGEGSGQSFATGTKVEAIGSESALTGVKINGTNYAINNKTYTAGTNVQISEDNVISATDTDTTYSAGNNVTIDADNRIHATDTTYSAGNNVTIDENNTISAVDTTYTAGTGIKIEGADNAISVDPANVNLSYRANNAATSKSVSLSQGLNFVGDGSVTVTTGDNGLVSIKGKNNYVTQGTYDAENKKLQLTREGVDGTVDIDLSAIKGGGWKLQTTGEAVTVEPESTVQFKGGNSNISVTNNGATVEVGLNSALADITSVSNGNASVALTDDKVVVNKKVSFGQDGKISNVTAGEADTDAVNVSQLNAVASQAAKHTTLEDGKNTTVETVATSDGHLNYKVNLNDELYDIKSISNGGKKLDMTGNQILLSNDGATLAVAKGASGIQNGTGASVVLMGQQTVINGQVVVDSTGKISGVADGDISDRSTDAINGSQLHATNERVSKVEGDITNINSEISSIKGNITTINTRLDGIDTEITEINTKVETNTQNIATNTENISKLNVRVNDVEELAKQHTTVEEGKNITVTPGTKSAGGKEYTVALNNEISLEKVTTGNTVMNSDGLKVGSNVSVTEDAVNAGSTSISNDGLKIGEKTYVSSDGLNANGQKITNVAAGEADTDAVNVSQLNATNEQVINNSNRISRLGDRVNKVGAGAAALAALHPMDFDPDDKWSFAAGYGNYAGENAAAVGAYYRPDEKVMFSVGGTVGNGENMVNAGISFALDRTNRVSNSRTAMAREIVDLRGQLTQVTAELASLKATLGVIDETKTKLFPDVPANHWAYEYISKLAGNGYVEGYPDGNFDGNRLMTRYEFAAMLYRAMEKGAALEERIINEFAPELGRIRVDRISGKDGDRSKIERVRVNGPRSERDHYGSKLK